ncbi:hypothetical protein A3K63_02075 [Candidatus Micrarchaeota archaeon RBG_16_49_10]|nr:MAG: hypothetical protein A3K63_02075 [Candidatus Micrarchaeota archaeon RBG_16_49_10]
MTEITIIAAIASNGVIGRKGKLPWNIKEDLEHFKKLTMGHPCIFGETTYLSLPIKPLPGRENIVLSLDKNLKLPGAVVKHSFEEALQHCRGKNKVFICGGASIYKQALEFADKMELTMINRDYEGDAYFPEFDSNGWRLAKKEDRDICSFVTFARKLR